MKSAESVLFRLTVAWTTIGLLSGLAYRELTRGVGFSGFTQLALVHTHTLMLGTAVGLILLALQRLYQLGEDRRFAWFVWVWNVGLALTAGAMVVKGTLQVLNPDVADSAALAGSAGLGHIALTVGFVLLFLVLGSRIRLGRATSELSTVAERTA